VTCTCHRSLPSSREHRHQGLGHVGIQTTTERIQMIGCGFRSFVYIQAGSEVCATIFEPPKSCSSQGGLECSTAHQPPQSVCCQPYKVRPCSSSMAESRQPLTNWHEAGKARVGTRQENPNDSSSVTSSQSSRGHLAREQREFRW
jgi:hypothetical protein